MYTMLMYLNFLFFIISVSAEANVYLRGNDNDDNRRKLTSTYCGCPRCTDVELDVFAGEFKCGDRIKYHQNTAGFSERDACIQVAGVEFQTECGTCDPNTCKQELVPPPPQPSSEKCGCPECNSVWDVTAGEYSCGARIQWLQTLESGAFEEIVACSKVAFEEFPDECGKCDPSRCNVLSEPTKSPTKPPTKIPTNAPTTRPVTNKPTESPSDETNNYACGCPTCNDSAWNTLAGEYKCGDRINYLKDSELGLNEIEVCSIVAGVEFPVECGECDPERCIESTPSFNNNNINNDDDQVVVKVMSYNTQYTGYVDGRLPYFADKIAEVAPDIVGLQECQNPNGIALQSGYTLLNGTGSQNYILYKSGILKPLESGSIDIPRDNYAPRTITWGKFRILNSGSEFWFFNTHLPHNANQASDRNTHARIGNMLLSKREQLGASNDPSIVVGDCNPFASSGATEGSFESSLASGGISRVYLAKGNPGFSGLDKIFASQAHWKWTGGEDVGTGRSDHPAIMAYVTMDNEIVL